MNLEQKHLIEACRRGERRAQLRLYEEVFGNLMSMARAYYRNREDCTAVVNAAYLKILSGIRDYSGEGSFEGWYRRIMSRTLIDAWRTQKTYKSIMQESEANQEDIGEEVFNEADRRFSEEEVREMLFALPEATRYVFNLFALEGYSHAEIAGMAGISEGTSRWHVNDARRILKKLIAEKLSRS